MEWYVPVSIFLVQLSSINFSDHWPHEYTHKFGVLTTGALAWDHVWQPHKAFVSHMDCNFNKLGKTSKSINWFITTYFHLYYNNM
jgi:hypothetical protein